MRTAIILQHVAHEGPGRIQAQIEHLGYRIDLRELHRGAAIPEHITNDQILIVMGGPMGVGDVGDRRYSFLAREIALLQRCLNDNRPVLGICLGAQLLAYAAGARVYPNHKPGDPTTRIYEVGWSPVDFIGIDREPALHGISAQEIMLHWHGDTFDLPRHAVHLASTPSCAHQMFRLDKQYGLQFHCEVDTDTIRDWIREDADYVTAANGADGARTIISDTNLHMPRHQKVGDRLIGNILNGLQE